MSSKYPVLTGKAVVRVLRSHGFRLRSQAGSHQKWRHQNGKQVIVPMHGSKPVPLGTLKSIVEGSGIDLEEFR